jgi:hypothetical protein
VLRILEREKEEVAVDVRVAVLSEAGTVAVVVVVSARRSEGERRRRAIISFK